MHQLTIARLFPVIILLLSFQLSASTNTPQAPKYGPAAAPYAVPLSLEHRYLQSTSHPASDYWQLSAFYVPQFNDYSCSVASVTTVMNALVAAQKNLGSDDKNITQESLLDKVKTLDWKQRVMPEGLGGQKGLALKQLEQVMIDALKAYDIKGYTVQAFEVTDNNAKSLEKFREVLVANEKNSGDFILIHFLQDKVTDAPDGPFAHISPIGAYDAANRKVLIMDVDRQWYQPYWVSDERLLAAISAKTAIYGYGGYIWIKPAKQ